MRGQPVSSLREVPHLWVVPVPAGTPRRLAGLRAFAAAVSPSGDRIAFCEGGRLKTAAVDGSDVRDLASLPPSVGSGCVGQIRWSPDGRRLCFHGQGPDGPLPWIWDVDATSGSTRPLFPGLAADWTADGRNLVFSRCRGTRCDLFSVRRPSWLRSEARPQQLTFGPTSFLGVGSSPDSRRLFAWGHLLKGELTRYDARTRGFVSYLGGRIGDRHRRLTRRPVARVGRLPRKEPLAEPA